MYLHGAGLSALVLKSNYRTTLNGEKETRVATAFLPNFETLVHRKRAHCSN